MEAGMFAIRKEHDHVTQEDLLAAIEKVEADFDRQRMISTFGAMFA